MVAGGVAAAAAAAVCRHHPAKQAKWLNASVSFGLTVVGVPDNIAHTATLRFKQHQHQPTARHTPEPPQTNPTTENDLQPASQQTPSSLTDGHLGRPANVPGTDHFVNPPVRPAHDGRVDSTAAGRDAGSEGNQPASKPGTQAAAVQRAVGCNKAYRPRRAHTQ